MEVGKKPCRPRPISSKNQQDCRPMNSKMGTLNQKINSTEKTLCSNRPKRKEKDVTFKEIEGKIFSGIKMSSKSSKEKANAANVIKHKEKSRIRTKVRKEHTSTSHHVQNINKNNVSSKSMARPDIITDKKSSNSNISSSRSKSDQKKRATEHIEKEVQSESSDWEDVDELTELLKSDKPRKDSTCTNVQIELEADNILWGIKKQKRHSKQDLIEDYWRKGINRAIKTVHENMHKTHLLCLLAHGLYLNSILKLETIMSLALSIVPKNYYSPKRQNMSHLEKFLSWFGRHISISAEECENHNDVSFDQLLSKRFEMKSANTSKELVLMFVVTARAVGMKVRYVMSLKAISWKPTHDSLIKPKKKVDKIEEASSSNSSSKLNNVHDGKTPGVSDINSVESTCKKGIKTEKKLVKKSRKMLSTDSEDEIIAKKSLKVKSQKTVKSNPKSAKMSCSSDEEFEQFIEPRIRDTKHKNTRKRPNNSDDAEISIKKSKKESCTEWAEVFLEEEEKWISVDVTRKKIHCVSEIESMSSLAYVVAFNPDQTIKDVTRRYVSSWLSSKEKIRCDTNWWSETLKPFLGHRDSRDKAEDKEMDKNLEMQPLPKTVNEYKNHSLYALQRHLLKFEAIYPPDEAPVGYIKGEPVFSRDSVKVLCGREAWIKEAKTVKVDEEPYKIVKARPKWDRSACKLIKDRPLELFGAWQVEDYEPPIAKNGKVPRNEYGNVELFKPCMIPGGCVHLTLNGLNRVARKLNIDCAPAIVGFDFHCGGSHPVCEGYVVCEEFKDILIDAWKEDQVEQTRKEEEKRIKRIYNNWKKLINGITMKDRLKEKYGVGCKEAKEENKIKKKIKQADLDSLQNKTVKRQAVALKIDLSASAIDNATNRQKRNRKLTRGKEKGIESSSVNAFSSSSDSENEELNLEQKKEKLRSILQWNPKNSSCNDDGPILSDKESDESDESECSQKANSKFDKHRSSSTLAFDNSLNGVGVAAKRNQKRPTKTLTKLSKEKKDLKNSRQVPNNVSDHSDSESSSDHQTAVLMTARNVSVQCRRSLRNKTRSKLIKYHDADDSETDFDISASESDNGDKSYEPQFSGL